MQLSLPPGFDRSEILAFQRRDPEAIAERVQAGQLLKGLIWDRQPLQLQLDFGPEQLHWQSDPPLLPESRQRLQARVRILLGLDQPIQIFNQRFRQHPELGPRIRRYPGLRIPGTATPFEALSWAIIAQQVSLAAATTLRRRLIRAANRLHAGGLYCYPEPADLLRLGAASLRQLGLSPAKTRTLLSLCEQIEQGDLWLANQPPFDQQALANQLLRIRGIGPWTVNYALLRGFGSLELSLHGDAGVRHGLQKLLNAPADPGPRQTRDWLTEFTPWQALAAAHLWALAAEPSD